MAEVRRAGQREFPAAWPGVIDTCVRGRGLAGRVTRRLPAARASVLGQERRSIVSRCKRTEDLEVHHKRRNQRNRLSNAIVMCRPCYQRTPFYGLPGPSPEPLTEETTRYALRQAGHRCECKSSRGCH
jgi:hypothetical protein